MGIKENIIELRKRYEITQEELAKIAGVTRGAVSQWEGGFSEPRMGSIQAIADHFGLKKSNIIEDSGMFEGPAAIPANAIPVHGTSAMVPVRVLGSTHAGTRMDELESDYEAEFPEVVVSRHPGCFALKVEGDCMNRRFPDGCHVLVDPSMEPKNGSAVIAEFEDGRSLLRVYMRGNSTVMLTADSFYEYEDIIVKHDDPPVRTVGVVVWFQAGEESE